MGNYSDENKPVDYIDGKLEQFSRLEFAFQLLSHNQYKLWGKIFKFGGCFSFFFIFIEHSNTNYFLSCTTKASVCETTQTETNMLTPKLLILYLTEFCSLLGVCLSAPFIYIGYNLFTNSTSGNRKNAKLLKDKQFELRKVTGAVVAYSSPVNKQVEISLFCTQHLIGWIRKCWNLLFQFCPVIGLHCLGGPGFSSRSVKNPACL